LKKKPAPGRAFPANGHYPPHGGALLILGAVSFPQWKMLPQAGPKALTMMVLGGGVVAGAIGMLCFYAAIKGAPLNRVMPIAFTSPLFGALMGILLGGEPVTWKVVIGMLMTIGGIVMLTIYRKRGGPFNRPPRIFFTWVETVYSVFTSACTRAGMTTGNEKPARVT
jgi:transporter family protein